MKKDSSKSNSLLQPVSMEDKEHYISRFIDHKEMTMLFNDFNQRREIASQIFADRWAAATVTVTKLNGEMFFID